MRIVKDANRCPNNLQHQYVSVGSFKIVMRSSTPKNHGGRNVSLPRLEANDAAFEEFFCQS